MITWDDTDADPSAAHAVLFDFDGTLADTKPTIIDVATRVLIAYGLDPAEVALRVDDLIGPPFPEAFSLVFGLSPADAAEVTRRYRAIYRALGAEAWPLFPGIVEMLGHLRDNGRLVGVASSKLQHMTERGVADNNARELFDVIVGKVDGVTDTKAAAIACALGRLGVDASAAVMVGDRSFDVAGAREANVTSCVGVLFGSTGTRDELAGAGAVAVVDTVGELEDVLLKTRSHLTDNGV